VTVEASGRRARKIAVVSAVVVVLLFSGIALSLHGKTDSGESYFHTEDQWAMVALGLLAAGGVLLFTRPKIIADEQGVRVRNLFGWKAIPWDLIAAVRFDRGSPWVAIDLRNDDVISVMAVQAVDKDYALSTVRTLRAMLAEHKAKSAAVQT